MNDSVDEMLRAHGRQWAADQPAPPALHDAVYGASARRDPRIKVAVAATVVAVAAIAGIAGVLTVSGGDGVPAGNSAAPTPPPSSAVDGTGPVVSTTSPVESIDQPVLEILTNRARSTALGNQDATATGEAVQTSYAQAEVALDLGTSPNPSPDTEVWIIQLHGTFTCLSCSHPRGASAPSGTAIALVLNAHTFDGYDFTISHQPYDLSGVGNVIQLPVSTPPPDYSTPAGAVTATCNPFEIISTHQMPTGETEVAWRAMDGVIWAALLSENAGDYRVQKCRFQAVPHG